MGKFLEEEKKRQAEFKATSRYFSDVARACGIYRGKPRPVCLPREYAEENLSPEIRHSIMAYFADQEIKWHDGQDGRPSNHLCDSQVCCANLLFPLSDKPHALAELLRPLYPTIQGMLPMEKCKYPGQFVSFEWIGCENYLGEKVARGGKRTRGANFTSADAAVMFRHVDGTRQIILIEWKYTESYSGTSLKIAKSGTDRTRIYKHLYDSCNCPLDKEQLLCFDFLFYEPFYQFMRQQFLAHEMEKAQELGAGAVSVLHIAPARNTDFQKVTSPNLKRLGSSATGVWQRLVRTPAKFISVSTERLFGPLLAQNLPELASWREYVCARYSWLQDEPCLSR